MQCSKLEGLMATPWQMSTVKLLSGISNAKQGPTSILNQQFVPPSPTSQLAFTGPQMFASVARAISLTSASPTMLQALAASVAPLISAVVDDSGTNFSITSDVGGLADTERTAFSTRLGAGIADRYMESVGYVWRANAKSFGLSSPTPDFVYDGPPVQGHGVVICEAKGAVASSVTSGSVVTDGRNAYKNQVSQHVGTTVAGSPILHGYAAAFGAVVGVGASYLHIEETILTQSSYGGTGSGGGSGKRAASGETSPSLALRNFRGSFALSDALSTTEAIDAVLAGDRERFQKVQSQEYRVVKVQGEEFWFGYSAKLFALSPASVRRENATGIADPREGGYFAIHGDVVRRLHKSLREILDKKIESLVLPIFDLEYLAKNEFGAFFPDGFAFLGNKARPERVEALSF